MTLAVAVLVTVGVVASLMRYLLPHDLHMRISTPLYGAFAPEHLPVLAASPILEATHRIGGALFLGLGVLQFMPRLRARRPQLHRWCGRLFLALALTAAIGGVIMALRSPYEPGEMPPSLLFAALMIVSAWQALVHIRRRDIVRHREWVTRCFAIGLGIATIRVYAMLLLSTTSLTTRDIIVPTFWAGWLSTLLAAELWIRAQRRRT